MFKKIALGVLAALVVAVVVIVGLALTKPADFHIERSTAIHAPPEQIYPHLVDFRQWPRWSPFENIDPQMQRDYAGSAQGLGAIYTWDGNADAGAGRMEMIRVDAPHQLELTLDFTRPFEASNTVTFTLQPQGDQTRVTWEMDGKNQFVSKIISVVMDMDAMVGQSFEQGLASLKQVAEQ